MKLSLLILALLLAGCNDVLVRKSGTAERIQDEMKSALENRAKPADSDAVAKALLPPLQVEMPKVAGKPLDPKFDLAVNNTPANQVFMALVSGTRYSMLVHPDAREPISVNLKDVTVLEALDAIRELYGYEYRIQGARIFIQPVTLQTRVFQVNYLMGARRGRSDVRVTSGAISDGTGQSGGAPAATSATPTTPSTAGNTRSLESSRVTTQSDNDFWTDVTTAIRAIVGTSQGRNVVVSPQSGVIVVRALPAELRGVEQFLKATQLNVERQVMLEAKIIEVSLRDGAQAGINWAAFRTGANHRFGVGQVTPGATIRTDGTLTVPSARAADGSVLPGSNLTVDPANAARVSPDPLLGASPGSASSLFSAGATAAGSIFGLAFQTANFAALLSFLETQGNVHVLSSPRIATLNNQKAVLKVGTDEFFVTNVTTTTTTTGTTTTPSATVTVQPFFSGIALDVMPQIDDENNIILHVHPSVSTVIDRRKDIDLGTVGVFRLPLASASINETDTIVRVQDGNIVAIGGLMRQASSNDQSQAPGLGDLPGVGALFRQSARSTNKSELVILLKPTVIRGDRSWQQDLTATRERLDALAEPQRRVPAER